VVSTAAPPARLLTDLPFLTLLCFLTLFGSRLAFERAGFAGAGGSRSVRLGRDRALSSGATGLIGFAVPPSASSTGSVPRPLVATRTPAAMTRASHPTFLQRTRASQSTPREGLLRRPFAPVAAVSAANLPRSMARLYDLMLLIDPNAPEERRTAAISEAESLIGSGGELVDSHDWGTRRMAYEIDHRPEADYRLYQFTGDNALLERLNQRLRILDAVLRFRIIRQKPGMPTPPPPEQQSARRRDDREPQDTRVAARAAADAPPV
jgi:small subunit ribosomal protein S6